MSFVTVSYGTCADTYLDINCAGEIRVAEDDDYEKWAIEIYVKFRDGEPLTLLTGQRQSGGVSKCTIMAQKLIDMLYRSDH